MKKHTQSGRIAATLFTFIFMLSFIMTGCVNVPSQPEPSVTAAFSQSNAAATALPEEISVTPTTLPGTSGIGYVSLDVNPSIQLAIKGGVVLGVSAFNDDGTEIIVSYDVIGKSYSEAISMLISALAAEGYLSDDDTEPSVVITAYGDVEDGIINDIETQAQQALSDLGLTCPVLATDVSDAMAEEAKSYGLTPGRYLLINYLADSEGLTIEAAIEKYGDWKMGALVHLVGESIGIYDNISPLLEGLTPEQIALLTQARKSFEAAMKAAVQANHQARAAAINAFKEAKSLAQQAFKDSKDHSQWNLTKSAAQQQFEQAKQQARSMFEAAKAMARDQFMAAVKALGLDPALVERMLDWGFDADWAFNDSWDNPKGESDENNNVDEKDDDKDENGSNSKPGMGGGKPENKPEEKPNSGKPGNKPDGGKPDKN